MNELQIFNNPKFGQVRTIIEDGKTLFVAFDIAKALGYARPNDAINQHCRYTVKRSIPHPQSPEKNIEVNVIPEGDIYRLAAKSELPGAEEFESWIFDDVLPTIRKTGLYLTPAIDSKMLYQIAAQLEAKEKKILELTPKAEFFDAVADSKDAIEIGAAAKVLNSGIGRNRLFEILRQEKILMDNNQPYQKYIDAGYFRTIEQKYTKPDSSINISIKTLVYQKGLEYIRKLLKKIA